jgi:kelch-like protein 20
LLLLPVLLCGIIGCKKERSGTGCGKDNRPPSVNAGKDQVIILPESAARLDGSKSADPDDNIVRYAWKKIAGPPGFSIADTNSAQTEVTSLGKGVYQFELKVTDVCFSHNKDTIKITVLDTVIHPYCYATANHCNGYWICLEEDPFNKVSYSWPVQSSSGAFGAAAANGNRLFFGGGHEEGYIGSVLGVLNIYDIADSSWRAMNLSIPRRHLSAASCGNKVLFAGGNNIYTPYSPPPYGIHLDYYSQVDIYDADNFFHITANLSEPRSNMAAASTEGKAFFIGGKTSTGFSDNMDVYDSQAGSWSLVKLPRERADAGAVASGNKIFIAGGKNGSSNITTVDVYDTGAQTWSEMEMPHEHPVAAMAIVNNKILIAGGDGYTNRFVDIFNTSSSTWKSSELSSSRYDIAVASANGKVIFLGGSYSCNVEIYDAATDTWRVTRLNEEVTGVAAAAAGSTCGFAGFLYQQGDILPGTVLLIGP